MVEYKAIKNILVVRNDRFGEFLLNIPCFRALKETFLNARITAVVNPYVIELAKCIPYIDEIIAWRQEKHTLSEKIQFIRLLRKKNIDIAMMLNPSKDFNIFTYLAGIPIRVGYNRKWGFLLTHKIEDIKYLGRKHEIDYNLELVGLIGAKPDNKVLSLKIDEDVTNVLKEFNIREQDNFIIIHPWTSDPIKQWPYRYFQDLVQRLTTEMGMKVVIIGGSEELTKDQELFNNLEKNVINLTGKTTLLQLAKILKKAKLLVSGDSGPVHLACCMDIPVIAIFRNDIPAKSSIRWGPLSKGSIVIEKNDLSEILVSEVIDKIKEVFKK